MDAFTYHNIFETKGIEYLAILAFFAILVPFWLLLNKQVKMKKPVQRKPQVSMELETLSAKILRIPQGIYYSNNHTWMHMEKLGLAKIGLDDLLLHITGQIKFSMIKYPGDMIAKGDLIAQINNDGKLLNIFSPISGEIIQTNAILIDEPGMLNNDPYEMGWMYRMKPFNWLAETSSCYLAEDATNWSVKELGRFKDFLSISVAKHLPEPSDIVLQDGGELIDHILSGLPEEVWQDFQDHFLNKPASN